ncbi:MAG: NnrU family protein [Pseudomonadota bacterium]
MGLVFGGVALWWLAHFFKRIAPGPRAALGEPGKGAVALALVASIALLYFGYAQAEAAQLYTPPAWGRHANNLLMLISILLFGMGMSKGRMRSWLRHPMLAGTAVWALAHLLVRGDAASVVMFGGLGLWALLSMPVISRAAGPWQRPAPGPIAGDIRLIVIAIVVYAVVVAVHWQVFGLYPFAG